MYNPTALLLTGPHTSPEGYYQAQETGFLEIYGIYRSHLSRRVLSGTRKRISQSSSLTFQDSSGIWHFNNRLALWEKIYFIFSLYFPYGDSSESPTSMFNHYFLYKKGQLY